MIIIRSLTAMTIKDTNVNDGDNAIKEINGHTFYPPTTPPDMGGGTVVPVDGDVSVIEKNIVIYADLIGGGYTVHNGKVTLSNYRPTKRIRYIYSARGYTIGVYYPHQSNKNYFADSFYWSYPPDQDDKKTILELQSENTRLKEQMSKFKDHLELKLENIHLGEQVAKLKTYLTNEINRVSVLTSELDDTVEIKELVALLDKYQWFTTQPLGKKELIAKIEDVLKSHRSKHDRMTASKNYMNRLGKTIREILQSLLDRGYQADPEGGLSELKKAIEIIIAQDKKNNWHGGVPKDAIVEQSKKENYFSKLQVCKIKNHAESLDAKGRTTTEMQRHRPT
jgi:hypothetical protein